MLREEVQQVARTADVRHKKAPWSSGKQTRFCLPTGLHFQSATEQGSGESSLCSLIIPPRLTWLQCKKDFIKIWTAHFLPSLRSYRTSPGASEPCSQQPRKLVVNSACSDPGLFCKTTRAFSLFMHKEACASFQINTYQPQNNSYFKLCTAIVFFTQMLESINFSKFPDTDWCCLVSITPPSQNPFYI